MFIISTYNLLSDDPESRGAQTHRIDLDLK